jgi:NAD(P)-dependent dehydrogenase (short-subunit alcohol dehydrogenase family)
MSRTILIAGGTSGIGLELAKDLVAGGDRVILTGRDLARAQEVAASLGELATGLALELSEPDSIEAALSSVPQLDGLVLMAIDRDANTVTDYDRSKAIRLVTLKLVGYTEVVHVLLDRLPKSVDTGIVLFGGRAKDAPYPGSMTVSTINGGVDGMLNALALELAPIRVNALHSGIIGDSPFWEGKTEAIAGYRARTPGGELATMADIVDAAKFLLRNRGVSGLSLNVDRGWRLT